MRKSVKLSGAGMPRQLKTLHSRILKMNKILLPFIILLSLGLTGCFDSSSAGDGLVGEWVGVKRPSHKLTISKESENFHLTYTYISSSADNRLKKFTTTFEDGALKLPYGGSIALSKLGDFLKATNVVLDYIEFKRVK